MAANIITIKDEENDVEKDLSPNIPKNFYPDTVVAINTYMGTGNMLLDLFPKPGELDVNNFEANLDLLEGESQEPPEDYVLHRCQETITRILRKHNVTPNALIQLPNRVEVHVPRHHMKAVTGDINLAGENLDLDLALISVHPLEATFKGMKPLSCQVKKMLFKSDGWTVESSVFCELIVRAAEMGIDGRPYPVVYCVIPAHLMLSLGQSQILVEANGDTSHLREHVKAQMKEQRYVFKNSNHKESVILQPPPLIAYRLWDVKDARDASSLEIQLDGDEVRAKSDRQEESISFMNDIALLKLSSYRHDEFADDTRLFPIYEKRQIVILARRKQRIVVGDFEGRLIYPPEITTSTNHHFGLHLAFILTSKDSSGKTHKLTEGSSGLVVFFKGKRNQPIPVGMLVGELDMDLPDSSNSSIYQAIVLSEALKEIECSYPRQLSNLRLLETCHQSPDTTAEVTKSFSKDLSDKYRVEIPGAQLIQQFNMRTQRDNESNEQYIRSLQELAAKCDFGIERENHIKHRLLTGMKDTALSTELIQQFSDDDITLETVTSKMKEPGSTTEDLAVALPDYSSAPQHNTIPTRYHWPQGAYGQGGAGLMGAAQWQPDGGMSTFSGYNASSSNQLPPVAAGPGNMIGGIAMAAQQRNMVMPSWGAAYQQQQQPTMGMAPQPMMGMASQPMMGMAPQPMMGIAPQPTMGMAPQPMMGMAPQPMMGMAPQPMMGMAPQPMMGMAPQPTMGMAHSADDGTASAAYDGHEPTRGIR